MKNIYLVSAFSVTAAIGLSAPSLAATINFDDQGLSGPSSFVEAGNAQTLNIATEDGNVRFRGGVILSNATNSPANQSSAYATANNASSFGVPDNPTRQNPLIIEFDNPIENFFLDIFNGIPVNGLNYKVSDELGNLAEFSLPSNFQGGFQKIGFQAAGKRVTVIADTSAEEVAPFPEGAYDFLIDNISFNAELPDDLLPPVDEVVIPTPPEVPDETPEVPDETPEVPNMPDFPGMPETPGMPEDPVSVPEPASILGLIAVGALGLLRRK